MTHMNDTIVRLVEPQLDWHILELTSLLSPGTLAEQTADLLIYDHLAAHCPDMASYLANWMRVLKPNGWLAAGVFHFRGKKKENQGTSIKRCTHEKKSRRN